MTFDANRVRWSGGHLTLHAKIFSGRLAHCVYHRGEVMPLQPQVALSWRRAPLWNQLLPQSKNTGTFFTAFFHLLKSCHAACLSTGTTARYRVALPSRSVATLPPSTISFRTFSFAVFLPVTAFNKSP